MMKVLAAIGATVLACCVSCGGDDDNDFPGVARWECYVQDGVSSSGTLPDCDCFGLGPNDELASSGTRVETCAGYDACFTYVDDFFEDPMCSCGDTGYMPPPASTEVEPIDGCPP